MFFWQPWGSLSWFMNYICSMSLTKGTQRENMGCLFKQEWVRGFREPPSTKKYHLHICRAIAVQRCPSSSHHCAPHHRSEVRPQVLSEHTCWNCWADVLLGALAYPTRHSSPLASATCLGRLWVSCPPLEAGCPKASCWVPWAVVTVVTREAFQILMQNRTGKLLIMRPECFCVLSTVISVSSLWLLDRS